MLVFNEGVPGSGKSYDSVANHILPAHKAKRRVYARVNGLDHAKIAAHLKMDEAEIRDLLVHVPTDQVRATFVAEQDEAGEWSIAQHLRNALVVIDEVHDFYVGGTREAMAKESEQFFALHRHFGLDVLIMTQFYKRVHVALRSRIERKNTFQKLSALGKQGESAYRVTYFQTIAPDRYEKIGGETKTYKKDVFPLYKGITSDEVQTEVYGAGRLSLWKTMLPRALIIVPLGLFSMWFLLDFFSGGGTALVKQTNTSQPVKIASSAPPMSATPPAPAQVKIETQQQKRQAKLDALSPEQRYVWELNEKGRIRLCALIGEGISARAVVEWIDSAQNPIERLTVDQLRALGISVTVHPYGVRLQAADGALVATAWPLNMPLRDQQPRLYDTSGGAPDGASASEHPQGAGKGSTGGVIAYAGDMPTGPAGGGK